MAVQTFSIEFKGYWREEKKSGIPAESGIYCVYSCIHNLAEKNLTIQKLIYIGESEDVKNRISNHEKLQDWSKYLKSGEELCYSFGPVSSTDRVRSEAALIFKHKPPENIEFAKSFPFDQTTMKLSEKIKYLSSDFIVNRT